MPTKNVVLTDYQAQYVNSLVASGRYQNVSEVLRDGLRLVERRDADEQARLEALREAARIGIMDMREGRSRQFDDAIDLHQHLASLAKTAIADQGSRAGGDAHAGQTRRRR